METSMAVIGDPGAVRKVVNEEVDDEGWWDIVFVGQRVKTRSS
jgi:hypothetical protein